MEVCTVTGGDDVAFRLNPYPPHYKAAFAFSILLYPTPHRLALRFAVPRGRMPGLPRFPYVPSDGLGAVCPPVVVLSAIGERETPIPTTCLLAQACQRLWLVGSHDVYPRFIYLLHTIHSSAYPQ